MLNRALLIFLCVFALLLAGGCGNNESGSVSEDEIVIELVNQTDDITIAVALFYGPNLDDWGEDLLGDETIEPGETVSFVLPRESYSIIPLTDQFFVLSPARDISEDYRLQIGEEGTVPVLVANNSQFDIASFYFSPSDSDDWGEDWLGGEVVASGIGKYFFVEPGTYDILALGYDGDTLFRQDGKEITERTIIPFRDAD